MTFMINYFTYIRLFFALDEGGCSSNTVFGGWGLAHQSVQVLLRLQYKSHCIRRHAELL